jgi:hypothetical protein
MRLLLKLVGLALLLVGVYFLGQNIIFTTQTAAYWWRDISAAGSVLAVTSGVVALLFFNRSAGGLGQLACGLFSWRLSRWLLGCN